jgi:hypothetical protein
MELKEKLANQSTYEWGIDRDVLWMKDLDQGVCRSVTNNIENILEYLYEFVPVKEYMIMYRDTLGVWDEYALNQEHSHIVGSFKSLNEQDYDKAILKLRNRHGRE